MEAPLVEPLFPMKALKFVIPNSFTALSLLLGLASVTRSVAGDFHLAAWMILWGVLLDKLDGTAARLLKASSGFGAQFDSFADFVVFGIAPAALFYYRLESMGLLEGGRAAFMALAAAAHVLATAGRLARFNITEPPMGDRIFYGVPTTLMGALLGSGYLTWEKYELAPGMLEYAPIVLVAGAVLMCSKLQLGKLKVRKSLVFNIFQFTNVAVVYVLGPLMLLPEYLFGCAMLYTVVGIIYYRLFPPTPDPAPSDREIEHGAAA
jgi:CDP-diacylglycerol--serine O-phosphatidyltransferase